MFPDQRYVKEMVITFIITVQLLNNGHLDINSWNFPITVPAVSNLNFQVKLEILEIITQYLQQEGLHSSANVLQNEANVHTATESAWRFVLQFYLPPCCAKT